MSNEPKEQTYEWTSDWLKRPATDGFVRVSGDPASVFGAIEELDRQGWEMATQAEAPGAIR